MMRIKWELERVPGEDIRFKYQPDVVWLKGKKNQFTEYKQVPILQDGMCYWRLREARVKIKERLC